MAGNFNIHDDFFGNNKQQILDRHAGLIAEGHPHPIPNLANQQDIMRATNPANQKGIGYSDIILGEELRGILADDNFIVAELIKNHDALQGKGVKSFKLSTDPGEDNDDFGLLNSPRVFAGNKAVIENIIAQSEQNTEQAEALINFAEEEYIADEVLASPLWQNLSRAEKIFHIIARYYFYEQAQSRIIRLLFGDWDEDGDEDEDGDDDEAKDGDEDGEEEEEEQEQEEQEEQEEEEQEQEEQEEEEQNGFKNATTTTTTTTTANPPPPPAAAAAAVAPAPQLDGLGKQKRGGRKTHRKRKKKTRRRKTKRRRKKKRKKTRRKRKGVKRTRKRKRVKRRRRTRRR